MPSVFDQQSDIDQAEMVALIVREESQCLGCGQPIGETLDPKVTWLIEDGTCQACWSKAQVEKMHQTRAGDHPEALAGLRVWVKGSRQPDAPLRSA